MKALKQTLSNIYRFAITIRNKYWDRPERVQRVSIPVISIGNLTVGGVGKTPLVAWLASRLVNNGHAPAIVSRGYKSKAGTGPLLVTSQSTATEIGDEPFWFFNNLTDVKVIVGSNRTEGARLAEANGASVVILDDGYQHRRLHRDVDILVWDSRESLQDAALLPLGRLREPLQNSNRADLVVISHSDQAYAPVGEIENFFAPRPVFTAQHLAGSWHAIAADYAAPAGKVIAFCGIANPENFRKTLLEAGVDVHDLKAFPDHHSYDQKDLAHLAERSLTQSFPLVTTEKDAARLSAVQLPPSAGWWSLGLKLSVDQEDDLLNAILARIES